MTHPTRRDALRFGAAALILPLAGKAAADGHATVHTVVIKDFAFSPANITINAGDTIMWVNEDNMRHSAQDLNGAFDTGLLGKGQSASLQFSGKGSFNYRCGPHANMRGSITIN